MPREIWKVRIRQRVLREFLILSIGESILAGAE
jgi:hypothetical protein